MTTLDRLAGAAVAATILLRQLIRPMPGRRTLEQRLTDLPRTAPTAGPLAIHWNAHQIPFVEAQSEPDLAVGLGIVHAHLRLGQMEIMRRLAQGRASEMAGPLGIDLDRALHLMDFARAVPEIVAGLGPEVRAWAEGFVRGVNHVLLHTASPYEFDLLGIGREPWTLHDLFANARLAAADVNWLVWGRLLRARRNLSPERWRALWPALLAGGAPNPESLAARAGSNASVVAGTHTRTGAALLAADPHLSVALPNIWLAAGMACPGLNVTGLMPAGLPLVAIGRNAHLAWAGTSLHHAASDLFDVTGETLADRHVTIRVRMGGRRRLRLRESRLGPVVSDGMLFRDTTPLAMKWVGHRVTDELGAMYRVLHATDSDSFAAAVRGFALPGQNFVHATADGRIGHLLACAVPRRPGVPADIVQPASAAAAWDQLATTADFPDRRDPESGVFASANDRPPPTVAPVGFLFSPPDRVERLRSLLGQGSVGLPDMAATQTDVVGSATVAHALAARLPDHPISVTLQAWDGSYGVDSRGAALFEAVMGHLGQTLPDQSELAAVNAVWQGREMLAAAALALPDTTLRPLLRAAMDRADALVRRHGRWGDLHVMRLRHYLAAIPVLGRRFTYGSYRSAGGNDTLDKTGHGPVTGPHTVSYGASARFLADLSHPDANRVVLLGGQDGAIGSTTFVDQVPLWRQGAYVDLPLRPESARRWPHHTVLRPA